MGADRAQGLLAKGQGIHIGHPVHDFKECKGLKQLQLLREAIVLGKGEPHPHVPAHKGTGVRLGTSSENDEKVW